MDLEDVADDARSGNVALLHRETARHHGDAVAIEHHGETITHSEFEERAASVAGGFADHGLEPGDVVMVYLPNCPAFLVAALGAFRAGLTVSPVNPQYRARELTHQLEDTGARAVVTHPSLSGELETALEETGREPLVVTTGAGGDVAFEDLQGDPLLVERADEDVALLPYTSGTTGRPKGVRLTHGNLRAHSSLTLARGSDLDAEDIRSLVWLPLYHITGFTHTAWQPLVRGGAVYLRSALEWDAQECMQLIEEAGITNYVGVTAMYVDMVTAEDFGEYDLTSLEHAGEGGAKMSVAIQEEFEATAGVEMGEGYGLTETAGATHSQNGSSHGLIHGTIGQPLRFTDCRIVDEEGEEVAPGEEGELLVRGPHVMDSYHGMPEATAAAFTDRGYFRTGDVARRDGLNYYEIVDRKKHVIVSAGYNIYPSELEELIGEHEAVAAAAVVGVPDDRRTEVPKAFVVPRPEVEPGVDVTAEEITDFVLDQVAPYKHPRAVEFIEELPRTASGKVQKFVLEERETER